MATFYLDFENGNDGNDGTTFANRWKTINSGATAARIAPGDIIRVMASPDPTSLGINVTFTNDSPSLTLASALNALITDCDSAWTASTNVTCNTYTFSYATGSAASRAQIAAGFTTGKIAYFGLGASNDYSAYQGITFWLRATAALTDSVIQVVLCSDTTGDTPVDTFNITGYKAANAWETMYFDKGSALGSAIQSIALYASSDPGTVDIILDNISTTKAVGNDCLNLTTLIGKQNGADGGWYPIRSINGTTVIINHRDSMADFGVTNALGFYGTTESVTGYIRQQIRSEATTTFGTTQDAGTDGNLITFSGGWDRTNMSTQSGETYVTTGIQAYNVGFISVSQSYNRFEKIHPSGWGNAYTFVNATGAELGATDFVGVFIGAYLQSGVKIKLGVLTGNGGQNIVQGGLTQLVSITSIEATNMAVGTSFTQAMLYMGPNTATNSQWRIGSVKLRGSNSYGLSWGQTSTHQGLEIDSIDVQYCKGTGTWAWMAEQGLIDYRFGTVNCQNNKTNFYFGGGNGIIQDLTVANPTGTYTIEFGTTDTNAHYGLHRVLASSISGSLGHGSSTLFPNDGWTFFRNYNGTTNDHRGFYDAGKGAKLFSETGANRHTPSGVGWRLDCLHADYDSNFPIRVPLGSVILESSVASTIRLWVKRSNTAISARLMVRGDEVAGVNTTTDTASFSAGLWEELSLTVTPTEEDELNLWLEVWGGTTHSVYFDDITVI